MIERYAPPGSYHRRVAEETLKTFDRPIQIIPVLAGITEALYREYKGNQFGGFVELVHADTFSDFLEMASYLTGSGYKDAAAVIAGSVLEQHLRELCRKHEIDVSLNERPKKADSLNSELARGEVYDKREQKNVTAWLGLRNEAAHGNYAAYNLDEVRLLIESVKNFVDGYPA